MFSLPPIPKGDAVLVTDELASPADFILHANLAAHVKDSSRNSRCILISVTESLSRWITIGAKSNINVPSLLVNGTLVLLDIEAELQAAYDSAEPILRPVFDSLQVILADEASHSAHTLVILDDISALEWIGFSSQDVGYFARALCAACRKVNASLIIRHHVVTPGNPDDLLRLLLQLCTYRIDVFPLSTGRSGSVSGQIAILPGPGRVGSAMKTITRSSAVLYRLTDSGSTFFERGTGAAVL
ncbi:hypothetical protein BDW22DRAFT_802252 [Trametopsis cervina]|nr:hypothetical protein BDW22DRAFT_802252 [Trametopsis cervina]